MSRPGESGEHKAPFKRQSLPTSVWPPPPGAIMVLIVVVSLSEDWASCSCVFPSGSHLPAKLPCLVSYIGHTTPSPPFSVSLSLCPPFNHSPAPAMPLSLVVPQHRSSLGPAASMPDTGAPSDTPSTPGALMYCACVPEARGERRRGGELSIIGTSIACRRDHCCCRGRRHHCLRGRCHRCRRRCYCCRSVFCCAVLCSVCCLVAVLSSSPSPPRQLLVMAMCQPGSRLPSS